MTASVKHIWRHPIKSHGREELSEVTLTEGQCLPSDRKWAVAHERSCFDVNHPQWQPCGEFSIGAKSTALQAIHSETEISTGRLSVRHPDRADLNFDPETEGGKFIQWVLPISNGTRALPAQLVRGTTAMTDTDYASISLINLASHREVEGQLDQQISPLRWRGNFLIDGWQPWAENELIGKNIRIGTAELEIREPIRRCKATTANTDTGKCDANTLAALRDGFGHQNMGVYCVVVTSGEVRQDDQIEVI